MIKVEGLDKYLGGDKILDDINIHVKKGSIYGLIGPNGAGKTTLIKNLVDIYEPDKGEVIIRGENIKDNTKIKSRLGYVSDFQYLYPSFKVREIVKFYKEAYPFWNEDRYNQLTKLLKLDGNKKIKYLSKGMKTQLAVLLTLSIMPNVLILDEPTSGLDPVVKRKVLNLIVDEVSVSETTVLISSHNLGELEQICDHIGIIHEGKILLEDSIENLKSNVRKIQVAFKGELPDDIKKNEHILKIESIGRIHQIVVKDNLEIVMEEIKKHNPILLETIDMSLEEIFVYKMGGEGYGFADIAL
ncbi:MAG TPA: ABC transporter ATP-binding protein [Thermoanaerobacterales bacterium]|jgi:ABC-2 type transport system ATP-binding protein|nr:ABC transporter ATP-binding protein [Thermoanaerobacterales bacterium]